MATIKFYYGYLQAFPIRFSETYNVDTSVLGGDTQASKKCHKHFCYAISLYLTHSFTSEPKSRIFPLFKTVWIHRVFIWFYMRLEYPDSNRDMKCWRWEKIVSYQCSHTGKMEYNENEIPGHKGCRHLLKKTFFLVQNHTVAEVGGDL